MANPKHSGAPEIPDLDLPVPSAPPRSSSNVSAARPPPPPPPPPSLAPNAAAALGGDFGMEIERGPQVSAPPSHAGRKQVAIDMGGGGGFGDDFGMEIERGGALSAPPSTSSRVTSGRPSGAGAAISGSGSGSGLDVQYQRSDLQRRAHAPAGPGILEKILAYILTLVVFGGAAVGLAKVAHRSGRTVIGLLPHAFDATATTQSGAVALSLLVLAIGIGVVGVKAHPRSYAMILSAAAFLIASLAMVTVTLVSTEEQKVPPDGALLIPWVVPAGLVLLGLGIAGRGVPLFLRGGGRRVLTLVVALIGGALVFAGVELSAYASRIPF